MRTRWRRKGMRRGKRYARAASSQGVVPGEALLSFRSKQAMDRFLQQAEALGLSVRGSIPELNSVRLQYGTLDQLRDALASVGIDTSAVEGNRRG